MKSIRFPAIAAVLLGAAPCASGQGIEEEDLALAYGDRATISIATGTRQVLRRAPAVATVITAEDIAAMGAVDLDEVMETVPGVHVARSPQGNTALYTMRGIFNTSNPQVLMLQNGVPMTLMFLGNKGGVWGGLPLENVARIEIIRGPGSALYGADAFAGVINIITKTAADTPGTELGARVGSFNSRDAWIQHGGKLGEVDVAAYLKIGTTDGPKETIAADRQTSRDTQFGTHASYAPGPMNLNKDTVDASIDLGYDKWRLRGGYKLRDNMGLGAGVAFSLDPNSYAKSERVTADLSWLDDSFARDWGLGFTASYLHYADTVPTNLFLAPPGAKLSLTGPVFPNGQIGGPNKWERQLRLSLNATYSGFAGHSVRLGGGHDDLNLYKTRTYKNYSQTTGAASLSPSGLVEDYSVRQPFMEPHRRKVNYAYLQDEWNFRRDWTLTAGVRRDVYDDVGGTTNPRIALVWDATVNVTAKILAGRAFRAPAFNELYGINNPVQKGNAGLQPEIIDTREAAVSWQSRKDLQLSVNVFHYKMHDIIQVVSNQYQNSGDQIGKGMEFEAIWDASRDVRLTGAYSYQKSRIVTGNTDAGFAPHHHFYTRGDWHFMSGLLASAQLNWVAERKRAAGDTRPDAKDYKTVDLTVRTERGRDKWDFAGSIRNLFNSAVYEPTTSASGITNDIPQPRRSFYLQASYSL